MNDWFVGCLWAIGLGLMSYKGTHRRSLGNWITCVAGGAAITVALVPTVPDGADPTVASGFHFGAATCVVLSLGILCVGFGLEDRTRDKAKRDRSWIHFCARHLGDSDGVAASKRGPIGRRLLAAAAGLGMLIARPAQCVDLGS